MNYKPSWNMRFAHAAAQLCHQAPVPNTTPDPVTQSITGSRICLVIALTLKMGRVSIQSRLTGLGSEIHALNPPLPFISALVIQQLFGHSCTVLTTGFE